MQAFKSILVASVGTFAIVLASAVIAPPIFAQTDSSESDTAITPSFEEPWDTEMPSAGGGPVLAPAPDAPVESEPGSMYVAPPPYGLIERPGLTPISPTSPMLTQSNEFAAPAGGFHPEGGFRGGIR